MIKVDEGRVGITIGRFRWPPGRSSAWKDSMSLCDNGQRVALDAASPPKRVDPNHCSAFSPEETLTTIVRHTRTRTVMTNATGEARMPQQNRSCDDPTASRATVALPEIRMHLSRHLPPGGGKALPSCPNKTKDEQGQDRLPLDTSMPSTADTPPREWRMEIIMGNV